MPRKHLILIHGRAEKPAKSTKERLVRQALTHGLDRIDPSSGLSGKIAEDQVKFTFVYYGDITNRELAARNSEIGKKLTETNDPGSVFTPCLRDNYKPQMDLLLGQTSFGKQAYQTHLRRYRDIRVMDDAARAVSWFASLIGLSDNIVRAVTADMGAYLMTRKVGSEIRQRLQEPLKEALVAGDDICLVAHSMGCIVAYDVLWKFSQMGEYADVRAKGTSVKLWLTLGCPLGEPGVRQNLYDAHERDDGKYPRDIVSDWVNIAAVDDFVSHDRTMKDDFGKMERYMGGKVRDLHRGIYTFWVGKGDGDGREGRYTTNPHKLYGYLDNPKVAGQIAEWMG